MTRREFLGAGATLGAAALFGALGGVTSTDEGRKGEGDDEPQ